MLANWRDSKGARIEHAIAEILGKPIYYEGTELPIGSDEGRVTSDEGKPVGYQNRGVGIQTAK